MVHIALALAAWPLPALALAATARHNLHAALALSLCTPHHGRCSTHADPTMAFFSMERYNKVNGTLCQSCNFMLAQCKEVVKAALTAAFCSQENSSTAQVAAFAPMTVFCSFLSTSFQWCCTAQLHYNSQRGAEAMPGLGVHSADSISVRRARAVGHNMAASLPSTPALAICGISSHVPHTALCGCPQRAVNAERERLRSATRARTALLRKTAFNTTTQPTAMHPVSFDTLADTAKSNLVDTRAHPPAHA